jgi:hypothetical protein
MIRKEAYGSRTGKPKRRDPRPLKEAPIHIFAVQLLLLNAAPKVFWFHVPNEGRRAKRTGAFQKRLGMLPGVADLVIVMPGGLGLFPRVEAGRGWRREQGAEGLPQALRGGWQPLCHRHDPGGSGVHPSGLGGTALDDEAGEDRRLMSAPDPMRCDEPPCPVPLSCQFAGLCRHRRIDGARGYEVGLRAMREQGRPPPKSWTETDHG